MKKMSIFIGAFFVLISVWSCQKETETIEPSYTVSSVEESNEFATKRGRGRGNFNLLEGADSLISGSLDSINNMPFFIVFRENFFYVPNTLYTGSADHFNPLLVEYRIANHPIEEALPWTFYQGEQISPNLTDGIEYIIQVRVRLDDNGVEIEYKGTVLYTPGPNGSFDPSCVGCSGILASLGGNTISGNSQVYAFAPAVCCD